MMIDFRFFIFVLNKIMFGVNIISKEEITSSLAREHWGPMYFEKMPILRQTIQDADKHELLRFLMEWDGDVEKASEKYKACQLWRQQNLPISHEKVSRSLQTCKFFFCGRDRVGRPVAYFRNGLHDPSQFTPKETLDMIVYETETMLRMSPDIEEFTVVIDMQNSFIGSIDIRFLHLFYTVFKNNYPSRAEVFIVYPINYVFRTMWSIIKHILDTRSQGRVYMTNTKEELIDFIEEDQLVDFLGGKNKYIDIQ